MEDKLTKKELCVLKESVNEYYSNLYLNTCGRDEFLKLYNEHKEIIRKLERLVK